MTVAQFRRLALGLPDAVESSHFNHPDFRVPNKIFATLGYPDPSWGMVKLTPWLDFAGFYGSGDARTMLAYAAIGVVAIVMAEGRHRMRLAAN